MQLLLKFAASSIWLVFSAVVIAQEAAPQITNSVENKLVQQVTATINPKLPPFTFKVECLSGHRARITISGGPKGYSGQTFVTECDSDSSATQSGLKDINFDGYDDFWIISIHARNDGYTYWTYNPEKACFEDAPEFSDITGLDSKNKILHSFNRMGANIWEDEYYRIKNSKPELFKSVEQKFMVRDPDGIIPTALFPKDPDNESGLCVQVTRLYKNGKVIRTFYKW